jgi:hypothetical protein
MKVLNFVTFIISIQIALSLKLAMFGDIGTVEWFKANPSPRNDNFVNGTCPLSYDMTIGLMNFRRLICLSSDLIKNADIMSIAGDVIYAETAKGGATANVSRTNDTEYNKNRPIKVNNTFPNSDIWNARLSCAWTGVRAVLENYVNWCGKQLPNIFTKTGNNYLALQLVEGNHSFDVDINIESQEMLNLGNNFGLPVSENLKLNPCTYDSDYNRLASTLTLEQQMLYPKIVQNKDSSVKVQFLDVNSYFFACGVLQNATAYYACTTSQNFYKYYAAYPTFEQANLYVYRFIVALQNLDPRANWRVTRGHHAMFTIDNADMKDFLYTPFIYNGTNYGYIIDHIKAANIHFHIASHMHLGYLLAFPLYNNILKNSVYIKGSRQVISSGCFDASSYFFNQTYINPTSQVNTTQCLSGQNIQLSINGQTPEYFIQFTAGSSGRAFDQLITDSLTVGDLIWGRSMFTNSNPNFGAYLIDFTPQSANIQYFEIQAQTSNLVTLNGTQDYSQFQLVVPYTFNITQNNQSNRYTNIDNWFFQKFDCQVNNTCYNLSSKETSNAIILNCSTSSSSGISQLFSLTILLVIMFSFF